MSPSDADKLAADVKRCVFSRLTRVISGSIDMPMTLAPSAHPILAQFLANVLVARRHFWEFLSNFEVLVWMDALSWR